MTAIPDEPIRHDESEAHGTFLVEREGKRIAELTYTVSGRDVVVAHTWVDPKHRGGTLAPSLVAAVADWARRGDRKIVPVCPYVRTVFARSPGYADVWKK